MTSNELRQKFLEFFEKNGHKIIPSASLVPSEEEQLEGKEKVLFTSAGMQPLIPYLTGEKEPPDRRLVDVQKCLRTDDIEEVGDAIHHTFFEMLGNWSMGAYWKEEAIGLSFKFLTKELGIPVEKLFMSVFAGDEDAPKDEESAQIWRDLEIPKDRIIYLGKEHNWWPTARKEQESGEFKNPFGPCGPDTEMFYWTGEGEPEGNPETNPFWVEIWNDVFMQFNRKEDGTLEELKQRNVDTGMGLERTLAVLNGKKSAYETDLFESIVAEIKKSNNNYSEKSLRIIADHLRAAVFLISENIAALSQDFRGSVLVKLVTRAITLDNKLFERELFSNILGIVISVYKKQYPVLEMKSSSIYSNLEELYKSVEINNRGKEFVNMQENLKSLKTFNPQYFIEMSNSFNQLKDALPKLPNLDFSNAGTASFASGQVGYFYHQSRGISEPVVFGTAQEVGFDMDEFKEGYNLEFIKQQEASRNTAKGVFKGGLAGHGETETKYHTATHLLHQALRDVLGPEVFQRGSNITSERLRFDFSFDRKLSDQEIEQIEQIVNERIKEDLKVDHMMMSLEEAKKMNAIGLFNEKYSDNVSIYAVGPNFELDSEAKDQRNRGGYYSAEFCGGPHVEHTGVIGGIKIKKEEAVSQGVRRIYAELV